MCWNRYTVILLFAFGLLASTACSKTTGPSPGTLMVTVVDVGGNPLECVTLTLTPSDITRSTDSDGIATFSDIKPGDYVIHASCTDFDDCSAAVIVLAGETTEKEITMHVCTGDLLFVVTDQDGYPVAGVTVTLDPGAESRETDLEAEALFENCAIGSYSYVIQGPGFDDISGSVDVVKDETTTKTVTITFPKGILSVYVRESFVDSLVANIMVTIERNDGVPIVQGLAGQDGRWTSPEMRIGTAVVSVPERYHLESGECEVEIVGGENTAVSVLMNRTHTHIYGPIQLTVGQPLAQYDHEIYLMKDDEGDGIFNTLDVYMDKYHYHFETAEQSLLACILVSLPEYHGFEFYACWSPILDTRPGHIDIRFPELNNHVSNFWFTGGGGPLDFPQQFHCVYPAEGAFLEIWYVFVGEWNSSAGQWDWELSWLEEDAVLDNIVSWDGVFNTGSYSGQPAFYDDENHWYCWAFGVLYTDGRYSETFMFPFSFDPPSVLQKTRVSSERKSSEVCYPRNNVFVYPDPPREKY